MSKSKICMWLGLGYKSLGIPLLGFPSQRQELGLLLCYGTMNKWLYGMIYLRLCPEEPGVDPIRKPGLCEGSQVGHLWAHWNCPLERGSGPSIENLWPWECD